MSEAIKIACDAGLLRCGPLHLPCRIGKSGFIDGAAGREGDAKTPLGHYRLRFGLYRADRLPKPKSPLTFRPLRQDDGWCDAQTDPAYNRFIRRPYPASHEALWREDGAYDILLVMSHNDSPPVAGLGSAVFIHIAQPDDRKTLGCIALAPEEMVKLLPELHMDQTVHISQ
ncbi:L,D-transpeptidase family protein [Litorimonas sp. WD9-15]|uniref:L,D-transpeptidase family protein n=1 Tax=Litorimonas sp. WD9-15 TaxID=3418716 RepID=UPI003D076366